MVVLAGFFLFPYVPYLQNSISGELHVDFYSKLIHVMLLMSNMRSSEIFSKSCTSRDLNVRSSVIFAHISSIEKCIKIEQKIPG